MCRRPLTFIRPAQSGQPGYLPARASVPRAGRTSPGAGGRGGRVTAPEYRTRHRVGLT
jgi:hypothetical protein